MNQSDLEKFLDECQLNSSHGCNEESCPPMHKLIAMVKYLTTKTGLHPDNVAQLNKIARGEQ